MTTAAAPPLPPPAPRPPARANDLIEFVAGLRRLIVGILQKELASLIRQLVRDEIRRILGEEKNG